MIPNFKNKDLFGVAYNGKGIFTAYRTKGRFTLLNKEAFHMSLEEARLAIQFMVKESEALAEAADEALRTHYDNKTMAQK